MTQWPSWALNRSVRAPKGSSHQVTVPPPPREILAILLALPLACTSMGSLPMFPKSPEFHFQLGLSGRHVSIVVHKLEIEISGLYTRQREVSLLRGTQWGEIQESFNFPVGLLDMKFTRPRMSMSKSRRLHSTAWEIQVVIENEDDFE